MVFYSYWLFLATSEDDFVMKLIQPGGVYDCTSRTVMNTSSLTFWTILIVSELKFFTCSWPSTNQPALLKNLQISHHFKTNITRFITIKITSNEV